MIFTFEAVYENGMFRPLEPLPEGLFKEGERLVCVIDYDNSEITIHREQRVAGINASEVTINGNHS